MTEILTPHTAAEKARELLASRVAVIEALAAAANTYNDAQAKVDEAARALAQAYADAERAGWSTTELMQFGIRKPDRRAPGRPRTIRKPKPSERAADTPTDD
jgi:hypothetical protein